jgi:hypothetical protein
MFCRPINLTGIKVALLAFLEVVYWGQQGLHRDVPAQPGAALTSTAAAATARLTAEVALHAALQRAQHLASCAVLLVHALQAAALRGALRKRLLDIKLSPGSGESTEPIAEKAPAMSSPPEQGMYHLAPYRTVHVLVLDVAALCTCFLCLTLLHSHQDAALASLRSI